MMRISGVLVGLGCVVFAGSAQAAGIVNGSFETGNLSGWTAVGDAFVPSVPIGVNPVDGANQALITTLSGSVSATTVQNGLGLGPGSLNALGNGSPDSGSGITQTFTANAGDVLSFNYNFLSVEPTMVGSVNDFAFANLNGTLITLANVNTATFVPSNSSFLNETGYQAFQFVIPTTGNFTLGLGVFNVVDDAYDSALLIDNVSLSSAAVPEPSTLALLGAGLAGFVGFGRRRLFSAV